MPTRAKEHHSATNSKNARYHKVMLMPNANVDGAHIRTLVLTLLLDPCTARAETGQSCGGCPGLAVPTARHHVEPTEVWSGRATGGMGFAQPPVQAAGRHGTTV